MPNSLDTRASNSIGAAANPDQYKASLDALKTSVDNLQQPLANIADGVNSINKSLTTSTDAGNVFKKKVEEIATAFNAWKAITEMFNGLKIAIAGTEAALSGGLTIALVAVTAFAPEIVKLFTSFVKGKEEVDNATLSINAMNAGLSSADYKNNVQNIKQLGIDINLASRGFGDQSKAVDEYNNVMGKTIGTVKNFGDAEAQFKKNNKDYLKAMARKAAGVEAVQQATEKYIGAQKELNKSDTESIDWINSGLANADEGSPLKKMYKERAAQLREEAAQPLLDLDRQITNNVAQTYFKQSDDLINKMKDDNDPIKQIEEKIKGLQKATDANIIGSNTFKQIKTLKKELNDLENPPKKNGSTGNISNPNSKRAQDEAKAEAAAEQLKRSSAAHQLQITTQGYGNELLQENAHFDEQKKILQKLYDDKLISQETYNTVSKQLEAEHHTAVASLIDKFNTEDAEKVKQLTNETLELEIKSKKDGAQKQKDELNQQRDERNQQYAKILADEQKKKAAMQDQINKSDPGTDIAKLKASLDAKSRLIDLYLKKQKQENDQTDQSIKKIDDDVANVAAKKINDKLLKNDQKVVDNANDPAQKQAAEKQLIVDKYKFEIEQATLAGKDATELAKQRDEEIKDIDDEFAKQKADDAKKQAQQLKDFELQAAQQVSNTAFSIVKNGISSQADAKIKQLETEKNGELANTSLTAAQKQAIQQDYQKKEAAVKAKAFKDEQLASIGQALINGALAVTKATAQTGVLAAFAIPTIIAETAVQVATIAAQKPPAYARGGVHYSSDGRGGVLAGYSRTDNTNAYLRSGEGIVVSEAMRVPWARNLVSAINVGFGGRDFSMSNPTKGYAVGGIFTDGGDANRYYNQPVNDQKNLANTIAYQMINNFPPVYVDVKDINNQQNILAQTINRVNL